MDNMIVYEDLDIYIIIYINHHNDHDISRLYGCFECRIIAMFFLDTPGPEAWLSNDDAFSFGFHPGSLLGSRATRL